MDDATLQRQLLHMLSGDAGSLSGWALGLALCCDDVTGYPVVVSLHRATEFRRSVVIAVLALKSPEDITAALSAGDPRRAMHRLFHDRARPLLRKIFGPMPGLATALGKMCEPFDEPSHYHLLVLLLTPGAIDNQRKRATALRHAKAVTSDLVTALARLDAHLVHPALLGRIEGEADSDTANSVLRYVQGLSSTTITSDDLVQALRAARSSRWHIWVAELVARKADLLPAGPLDDSIDFRRLDDATQFASIGRQLQNCLGRQVLRAATGRAAFYFFNPRRDVIVELLQYRVMNEPVWVLLDIHGYDNRAVNPRLRGEIEGSLRSHGIAKLEPGYDGRLTPDLIEILAQDIVPDF